MIVTLKILTVATRKPERMKYVLNDFLKLHGSSVMSSRLLYKRKRRKERQGRGIEGLGKISTPTHFLPVKSLAKTGNMTEAYRRHGVSEMCLRPMGNLAGSLNREHCRNHFLAAFCRHGVLASLLSTDIASVTKRREQ